jgi:hypothetical protein
MDRMDPFLALGTSLTGSDSFRIRQISTSLSTSRGPVSWEHMKKIQRIIRNYFQGTLDRREVSRLIVKPIGRRIQRQKVECLKQVRRIIKKLQVVEESVDIIARELARQIQNRGR